MIHLHLHFTKFLECAKCCQSILGIEGVDSDRIFTQMIIFLLLSPHSKDQQELTHQAVADKRLKAFPILGDLLKIFGKKELIRWLTVQEIVSTKRLFQSDLFSKQNWLSELQKRVIEHVSKKSTC